MPCINPRWPFEVCLEEVQGDIPRSALKIKTRWPSEARLDETQGCIERNSLKIRTRLPSEVHLADILEDILEDKHRAVPHVVAPAWAATSIAYAPSPDARAAADPGVIFVGAHLAAVNGKGSLRVTNSDHRSTGNDDHQVNNIPVLVTDAHARHGR